MGHRYNDTLTDDGAKSLARTITRYWAKKGHTVKTTIQPLWVKSENTTMYTVRSDMINGMPRKAA